KKQGGNIMKWSTAIVFIAIILVGCQSAEQYSPEQVMEKAIESEVEETPYYGEMTIKMEDDEDTFELKSKEWRKGNKSLEEVVAEGEKVIVRVKCLWENIRLIIGVKVYRL